MRHTLPIVAVFLSIFSAANAFPAYQSLAGLGREELDIYIRTNGPFPGASPPPPPVTDTRSKLVNDARHPFKKPRKDDLRGPCPGLNTLASHGYLDRSGIATPQEIITACQDGFNMKNDLAVFITFGAHIVDGNQLTNLMSIGPKSHNTGEDPPPPAIVGGLNTHGLFEGDASLTRGDFAFGDNHSFNETLFDQLVATSNQLGGGKYNSTAATQVRFQRIQDSIARNPTFDFTTPRFFTAYAEAAFLYRFFVDGRDTPGAMDLDAGRNFFQKMQFPDNFHRREGAFGFAEIVPDVEELYSAHPEIVPGGNQGAGNFVPDLHDPGLQNGLCGIYVSQIGKVARLYPNPTDKLRKALKQNVVTFFNALSRTGANCTQLFPFGT